jgi:NADH-quinone oxidoreductase subunit G
VQLAVATARPSALDPNARLVARYAPGDEVAFLSELSGDLDGEGGSELARLLRDGGEDVVIVWSERLDPEALTILLGIADRLGIAEREGAGLLEIPAGANGRGLREVGVLPNSGPGYADLELAGRSAAQIAQAAADGDLTALYLFETDPIRDQPNRALWERALHHAGLVVAHASVLTAGIAEHANVVFPADTYAEKDGTVVHPDGRIQRLRTAIAHPPGVRAGWSVIAEIAESIGLDLGVLTSSMAFAQLVDAVPFYKGITLEQIGGRGVRWPEREGAANLDLGENFRPAKASSHAPSAQRPVRSNGALRLGTYRPIWASPEVEISPSLKFAVARQQAELSPEDAQRLGIVNGETVEVAQNGTRLNAHAAVRSDVPPGAVFLATGLSSDSANVLTEPEVEVRKL